MNQRTIHKDQAITDAIARLAKEVREGDDEPPALVGIRTNGVLLAGRLADALEQAGGTRPELGAIDITLYRDDLGGRALPTVHGSEIPFSIEGRRIVLVDDVLFTGRTVRAALAVLADYGRPRRIELCVLVDRGHRELPVCADYTAFKVKTEREDEIHVRLKETTRSGDEILHTGQTP